MMQVLLEYNYPFFISTGFLLFFIITNRNFNKEISRLFYTVIILLSLVVISDNVGFFCNRLASPCLILRKWMNFISNVLRPFSLYFVILLFIRDAPLKLKHLLLIPGEINLILNIVGMFTKLVCHFNEFNQIYYGPLNYSAAITAIIYISLMLFFAFKSFSRKNYLEFSVMVLIFSLIIFGIMVKNIFGYYFVLNAINSISLTFIYLYMNVQKYKRDDLTNVLNRRSFVIDEERLGGDLKAIISIDLNNLKVINDTQGHEEGDKALITLCKVVNSCLLMGTELYRTGGDEFEILCGKKSSALELEKMMLDIRLKMDDTPYRCAMGIGYSEPGCISDPEQIRAKADAHMYEDKSRMKGGSNNVR